LILIPLNNMKAFNKILVLENDETRLPVRLSSFLSKNQSSLKEIWYNFNHTIDMKRLVEECKHSMFVCEPSFVGYDNEINSYVLLFLNLKELNADMHICLIFDDFVEYLLDFIYSEGNKSKIEAKEEMVKEVLDYHSIFTINHRTFHKERITWDSLIKKTFN